MAEALMTYGVEGPQGIQGPAGPTGPQGPRGACGSSGSVSISTFSVSFPGNGQDGGTENTATVTLAYAKLVIVVVGQGQPLICGRNLSDSVYYDGGWKGIKLDSSGRTLTVTCSGYSRHGQGYAFT